MIDSETCTHLHAPGLTFDNALAIVSCSRFDRYWMKVARLHLRPGHDWIFEFGKAQDGSSSEKFCSMQQRNKVEYKVTLFYDGQSALVVNRWLHRVDDDASGLTFEEEGTTPLVCATEQGPRPFDHVQVQASDSLHQMNLCQRPCIKRQAAFRGLPILWRRPTKYQLTAPSIGFTTRGS